MQANKSASTREPRLWFWPAAIIGLLSLHALAMGVVVFIATRDPTFAVEPEAYRKAVAWDRSQSQRQESSRLGWTATLQTAPSVDGQGHRRVTCRITDAQSVGVVAATVMLEAFPHARAAERFRVPLEPHSDGTYIADLPTRRAGTWEFRVSAARGDEQFSTVLVQTVGGGA